MRQKISESCSRTQYDLDWLCIHFVARLKQNWFHHHLRLVEKKNWMTFILLLNRNYYSLLGMSPFLPYYNNKWQLLQANKCTDVAVYTHLRNSNASDDVKILFDGMTTASSRSLRFALMHSRFESTTIWQKFSASHHTPSNSDLKLHMLHITKMQNIFKADNTAHRVSGNCVNINIQKRIYNRDDQMTVAKT